jgi:hypothetical protein
MDNPLFELQPSFYFKTDMAAWQLDLNADLVYNKRFSGGIGYRINDAVIVRFEGNEKWIANRVCIRYYNIGSRKIWVWVP